LIFGLARHLLPCDAANHKNEGGYCYPHHPHLSELRFIGFKDYKITPAISQKKLNRNPKSKHSLLNQNPNPDSIREIRPHS